MNTSSFETVLWPGVLGGLDIDRQFAIAQKAGFTGIAVSPLTAVTLAAQGVSHESLRLRALEHGLTISHLDGMSSWAPVWTLPASDPAHARYGNRFSFPPEQCLDIANALQARSVVAVGMYESGTLPISHVAESFSNFCSQARQRGVRVELEPIPFSGVRTLAAAWEILRVARAQDAGLMIDTWHFCKAPGSYASDLDMLRTLPAELLQSIQLADSRFAGKPADPLAELTHHGRGFPGEGVLPIVEILTVLMRRGSLTSIGPEPSSRDLLDLPSEEIALRARDSTRRALSSASAAANSMGSPG